MRIDDLDHLPETTTIDASSIGIVQVSTEQPYRAGVAWGLLDTQMPAGGASRAQAGVGSSLGSPIVRALCLTFVSHSVFSASLLPKNLLSF